MVYDARGRVDEDFGMVDDLASATLVLWIKNFESASRTRAYVLYMYLHIMLGREFPSRVI